MMVLNVITGKQLEKIRNLNFNQKTTENLVISIASLKGQRTKNKEIKKYEIISQNLYEAIKK